MANERAKKKTKSRKNEAIKYANDVISGKITAGMEVSLPSDKTFDLEAMRAEMLASMGG